MNYKWEEFYLCWHPTLAEFFVDVQPQTKLICTFFTPKFGIMKSFEDGLTRLPITVRVLLSTSPPSFFEALGWFWIYATGINFWAWPPYSSLICRVWDLNVQCAAKPCRTTFAVRTLFPAEVEDFKGCCPPCDAISVVSCHTQQVAFCRSYHVSVWCW